MSKLRWIGYLAMAAACCAQTAPDAKPGVTLRTTTTLVQVRVIAHDAKGRALTDLKQEDFEVFDNGVKQKIAVFSADTAASARAEEAAAAPAAFSDDKTPPPEKDHGYAVVLLDYLNSGRLPAMWARNEVERLLKRFDPAGKAALDVFDDNGITELGDFGTDREALLAKIGKTTGQPSDCSDNPLLQGIKFSKRGAGPPVPAGASGISSPTDAEFFYPSDSRCEEGILFFLYQRDLKTIDMLERFADRLSFIPGRKALIWVTTAGDVQDPTNTVKKIARDAYDKEYPLPRLPELEARIESAIRKLNNADVGLYTVDACPIDTPATPDPCWEHPDVLKDFAKRTGGETFPRSNDIAGAVRAAVEDVRTVYSLAFYAPPDLDPSKFHQLKVQVNRPGIKLSYRQGYSLGTALTAASLAKEVPGADARATRLRAALTAPSIFRELESLAAIPAAGSVGAAMTVPYFYTGANVAVVDVAMEIGVGNLKFKETEGRQRSELNLAAEAVRPNGAVAARFTDTVKLSFATEAETEAFAKRPYRYEHQFRLAPGKYDVRVAFGSGDTGLGRAAAPLTVDGWDGKALAISGVALARETRKADAGAAAAMEARKALVSRGTEIVPTGNARFRRGEPCKAYFAIYDPSRSAANAQKLSAQFRVLDAATGEQKVDSGAFAVDALAKADAQTIPVSLSVPVDGLAPGKYKLEVSAMRAGSDAVRRVVDFEVKE